MTRTALYARVSSAEQAQEGYSIDGQLEHMRSYANSHGHQIIDEYVDAGFDSSVADRPALTRLIDDGLRGNFEALLVYRYDRLFREARLFLDVEYQLRVHGVKVISVTEPIDDTHEGRLQLLIKASFAEYEKAVIRQRANLGRLRAAREGRWLGAAPYGYDFDRRAGELFINETEAAWVKKFFKWIVEDKLTIHGLQQRVNGLRIPTKSEGGSRRVQHRVNRPGFWMPRTLGRVVTRELYTGTFRYGGNGQLRAANLTPPDGIAIRVPQIIDEDLFQRAQKQLRSNFIFAPRRLKREYLLRRLLRCGACGRSWMGKTNSKGYRYYRCLRKHPGASSELCGMPSITARNLEPVVWAEIVRLLENPAFIIEELERRDAKSPDHKREQVAGIIRQITSVEAEARRVFDAYKAGAISLEKFQNEQTERDRRLALLVAERRRLERELEGLPSKEARTAALTRLSDEVRTTLHHLSDSERYNLIRNVVDKVVVGRERLEIYTAIPLSPTGAPLQDNRQIDSPTKEHNLRSGDGGVLRFILYANRPPKWHGSGGARRRRAVPRIEASAHLGEERADLAA